MNRCTLFAVMLVACSPKPERESEARNGRLPDDATPLAYALTLDVDLHNQKLTGDAAIQVRLGAPRRSVWLHAGDLKITAINVDGDTVTYEQIGDTLHVVFADWVRPRVVTLNIQYERSIALQDGNLIAEIAPMTARAWFPCFDEPHFKTAYDITIVAPPGTMAVSATRPRRSEGGRWEFERTPPLPSHLISFAVGKFDVVESGRVRALAPQGRGDAIRYAAEQATPLIEELERYFGIPYPFDKLDIIAASQLSTGALENAAALTFHSRLILTLADDAEAKRAATEALAHELAHMWFGDYVSIAWWDDLWLSESFASWMGRKITHADGDRVEAQLGAMQHDSLGVIRPIRHSVSKHDDVAFDPITYGKGMAVVAMVEAYVGEEAFRDAVRRYVQEHRYGTATTNDFITALRDPQAAAIVRSFIDQPGVPWVSATVECPNITLTQQRYTPLGASAMTPQTWAIPVCVGRQCWLLDTPSATFTMSGCRQSPMLNHAARGYYRFEPPVSLSALSSTEMLATADSLGAWVTAGKTSARTFLHVLPAMAARHDERLDQRVMETLRNIRDHHLDAANRPRLAGFARRLFADRVALAEDIEHLLDTPRTRETVAALIRERGHASTPLIADGLCSDEDAAWVREQFPGGDRATTEVVETITQCAALDRAYHAEINDFFRGYK